MYIIFVLCSTLFLLLIFMFVCLFGWFVFLSLLLTTEHFNAIPEKTANKVLLITM